MHDVCSLPALGAPFNFIDGVTTACIGSDSSSFGVSSTIACPPAVAGTDVIARRGLVLADVIKPVSA